MRSRFPTPSFAAQVRLAKAWFIVLGAALGAEAEAATGAGLVDFNREIQPLLEQHCYSCHGTEKQKGGLRLDNKTDAFTPGDSGDRAIVPHAPDKSLLIELLLTEDDSDRMPQKAGRLPEDQIALLRRWVAEGANWPDAENPVQSGIREMVVTAKDREYWAYRPLKRPSLPAVTDKNWIRTPVDRFVLARLENAGQAPAPEAAAPVLRRRLSFSLVGLPPRPGENSGLEALLATKAYGEHWARLWLDVARYADSDGYESDRDRKEAWRYRDFVIQAFNDDLSFDEFVRWQLAGDELAPDNPQAMIATGFLALGPHLEIQSTETLEYREKARYDQLDDIVGTTGSAFLGLTIACARCHDHKYDAIPARDYYALTAAFASGERGNFHFERDRFLRERLLTRAREQWLEKRMAELNVTEEERELFRHPLNHANNTQRIAWERMGDRLTATDEAIRASLSPEAAAELAALDRQIDFREPGGRTLAWRDRSGEAAPSWLLSRGDAMRKVERQPLAFLQVLTRDRRPDDYVAAARSRIASGRTTGQRAALAMWLTDVSQGAGALTARVLVNRIWQAHFGEGLVRTPNDFGVQGEPPTDPELLEWLAAELVDSGWSIKHLQRLIVNSATWRQGGAENTEGDSLAGRRPKRLEAEAIRDALLAVAGRLGPDAGGPAFRPFIPEEAMATRSRDAYPKAIPDGPAVWRRSIYHFMKRSVRLPMLEVFDAPDSAASSGRRLHTIVPTQQLTLLNDTFVRARARDFAERLERETAGGGDRIRRGFQLALGREPVAEERYDSEEFIARTSLVDWCHALFTLNEFVYVD